MEEILIPILVGIICTSVTWLLSKDKYKVEVTTQRIKNMEEMFTSYEKIIKMNSERMEELLKQCLENKLEILNLKKIVSSIVLDSCKVTSCKLRQVYTADDIAEKTKDVPNVIVDSN